MKLKRLFLGILFILFFSSVSFLTAQSTTPAPYEEDEFPQGLKDLRRFEIIALGSMPFVTLDVNFAYSLGKPVVNAISTGDWSSYSFKNPLTASANYSTDEIKGIIWTSIGISVGIALTDYIINLIHRNKIKRAEYLNQSIQIYNITEDEDAVKLENPAVIPDNAEDDVEDVPALDTNVNMDMDGVE